MSIATLNLIEVILNGLMVGVLYSLVALGFVLIFKASGIFNYAQGVLALFAALTLVGLQAGQVPFAHLINAVLGTELVRFGWTLPAVVAILLTVAVMVGLAFLVERLLLRHLVNQEPIILFMATIGLAYFLEGLGDLMWGADVKAVNVGLPSGGSLWWEDLTKRWAPADSGLLGHVRRQARHRGGDGRGAAGGGADAVLAVYRAPGGRCGRWRTTIRRRCRSASPCGRSGSSPGRSRARRAGRGRNVGREIGCAVLAALIALKALPVLILGGFTSIPGAIVGGLIIGVGEKLFEYFVGPVIGGATENWFAYVLALAFLMVRPQGLFGERIIERV